VPSQSQKVSGRSHRRCCQLGCETFFGKSQDLTSLTLKEASVLLRRKTASPVDLTQACLERIETYNSELNAFITVTKDEAIKTARAMEVEQHPGKWRGPLHSIPIALKDNIDTAGIRTAAASELFKHRVPTEDAEVVRRLKNAGAILLGKTNLHEFAYGGTSSVSYFGPVHNPWALDKIPGGSSGGSAAATAADSVLDRWEPTPGDQSESLLATEGSSASSPPMGA
jgi:aspartyl-tRNA(Asn)/glutamyl-tRNA(Gln) amidotransferase subunit A